MKKGFYTILCFVFLMSFSCSETDNVITDVEEDILTEEDIIIDDDITNTNPANFKILSLGDSYTIGQSVCDTCRFPEQLKTSLINKFDKETTFNLQVIARTGWTTTNLINAIKSKNISSNFDIVTLLIGVNNQYQGKNFTLYEK